MLHVRTDMRGPILMIMAVVGGCKGNPTCEKFVEMSMTCPDKYSADLSSSEKAQTKSLLVGMCEGAMNDSTIGSRNDKEKQMVKKMNATIRKKAECVAAAATCEEADKCDASSD